MSTRERRSESRKKFFQTTYTEIDEFHSTGRKCSSRDEASKIVAMELRNDWINKNVYPMHENSIARKIKEDYERFNELRKAKNCESKSKSDSMYARASDFTENLSKRACDIRCQDASYQKQMEEDFGVKMTQDVDEFYKDNCLGAYKAICTRTVPKDWIRMKKRKAERERSTDKKRLASEEQQKQQLEQDSQEMKDLLESSVMEQPDEDFSEPSVSRKSFFTDTDRTMRSSKPNNEEEMQKIADFPRVKIRTGRKTLNEAVVRCLVQCLSETSSSPTKICKLVVNVANILFGQEWKIAIVDDDDVEESEELTDTVESDDEDIEHAVVKGVDLTYVLPSRRTITRYLEDASYLSLEFVATQLLNKGEKVVTTGIDDTSKAAGHGSYDIKTDHITLIGPDGERSSLTTGYVENISHSGEDSASAYNFKLNSLALLANCTTEEIIGQIDFWMTDRASDSNVALDHLGVASDKELKCTAHISLGIENAIDKVFKNTEQKLGSQNLIRVGAGQKVFNSPGSSIHTLGLISLAKLLSPSHAAHYVSLCNDYKLWLSTNGIEHKGFKGFISNRFGRIAELAQLYLDHREHIKAFFNQVVDVNSNKLVLAVSAFLDSEWFTMCSEIYISIGQLVIFPLLKLLGVDEKTRMKNEQRTWSGVKSFFDHKLEVLKDLKNSKLEGEPTGVEKLEAAVIEEVIDTIERQINAMSCLKADECIIDETLKHTPLTNLGCESQFAKFDNRIRKTGGSTSVKTHSQKNVVVTNGLLVNSEFVDFSDTEKRKRWKWARCSEEVRKAKQLERDFLSTVKAAKDMALLKKEQLKLKKSMKTLNQVDVCKAHGGPITKQCLPILDELNEKQLLAEISYLRLTVSPDIRQMRRVKVDGKYKMEKFSIEQLRRSIRNANDENVVVLNIIELLSTAL